MEVFFYLKIVMFYESRQDVLGDQRRLILWATKKCRVEMNMEAQLEQSSQDQDGLAGDVNESLGLSSGTESKDEASKDSEGSHANETLAVQKRLKSQRRAHEREVHALHARISEMESRMAQPMQNSQDQQINPYSAPQGSGVDEQIHKAVSYALAHKEMQERKAHEAQSQAHVHKKYQDFQKHLDNMSDRYDDFHDVVLAPDAKFTPTMRDYAARTMSKQGAGSAGEVLYKLGKNPTELERISRLHPDDQAEELHTLSLALSANGEGKSSVNKNPLGNIKSNPAINSNVITDKTPVGELRKRMREGWK